MPTNAAWFRLQSRATSCHSGMRLLGSRALSLGQPPACCKASGQYSGLAFKVRWKESGTLSKAYFRQEPILSWEQPITHPVTQCPLSQCSFYNCFIRCMRLVPNWRVGPCKGVYWVALMIAQTHNQPIPRRKLIFRLRRSDIMNIHISSWLP